MTVIDELDPIDLDELTELAGLQVRTDRKYVVPTARLEELLASVDDARVLQIEGHRRFGYASTYFDTPDLLAHAASAHRRRRRFKVRTRTYTDSGSRWLEVKTRGRRGVTVKERIAHAAPADVLDRSGLEHVRATLAAARVRSVDAAALRPTLATRYRRTTLLLADGARATIDTALAWRLPDGAHHDAGPVAVLETKSPPTAGRSTLDRQLADWGFRPDRISKYATGLALMVPTVPRNRWHRVMTGPLAQGARV